MYIPQYFSEKDPVKLLDVMRQFSFALLVSQDRGSPIATHLPLLPESGVLFGHVARANEQWKSAEGQRVMAVFSGPHAYISPSWYEAANTVPTWNYVAVHAYGAFHAIKDHDETMQILERTVSIYEHPRDNPWRFDSSADFYNNLANSVVAFRIDLDSVEGKFKLNQNHPVERRTRVIEALDQSSSSDDRAVAALMKARL